MAFEDGLAHPETLLEDRPARSRRGTRRRISTWTFQGTVTARRALQLSLNVPAIALLDAVGPASFLARLRAPGPGLLRRRTRRRPAGRRWGGLGINLTIRAPLCRVSPRRRGARAHREAWTERRRPSAGAASPSPSPPSTLRISCAGAAAAERARGRSPSRPAPPTASATRWRRLRPGGDDRGLGRAAGQRPAAGLAGARRRRRSCSTLSRASDANRITVPPKGVLARLGERGSAAPLRALTQGRAEDVWRSSALPALKIAFPPDGVRHRSRPLRTASATASRA